MSWSDNRRVSTDVGWYMPYFTTAEYGWQVREPIHDMLIRIIDNTYDPELMPDFRDDIHFIADQMMAPDRKVDGKDGRYVSTVKKYLVSAFNMLDISRAQWEYVAPGGTPYPFDESCEDEIISIWEATDPTIVREQAYKAFMKLAYGDWINYDKKHTTVDSPKTVVASSFTKVTVHGTENGLGTMVTGINYLQPRLEPIPNGSIGILNSNSGWQNLINGYTFYSDTSTVLTITFKSNSDNDIHPSDIADVMLVEGSTIPSVYDSETNLFIKDIHQGAVSAYDINSTGSSQKLNQAVYATPDAPYGNTISFVSNKRCYNYQMTLSPNTYYSIRIFNSTVNDIVGAILLINPLVGTVTPIFSDCSAYTQKSIPSNGTFDANTEQWIRLNYTQNYTREYYYSLPLDARPIKYEYCNYYATLKAGTYKVMIDSWGNNRFFNPALATGIQDYTGCMEDNFNYTGNQGNEWFALVEEDNTVIIQKSDILPSGISSKTKAISDGAPYPNYFHKEVTFTLDHDCKVGLIHKAYYESQTYSIPAYHRFMIVDSDVEAVYFETTGAVPAQMQGYSAWEKYQMVVSVNVQFTDVVAGTSTTLTKTVSSLLYSNDSVDFTQDLPAYSLDDSYGIVTVEVLDKDQEDPTIVPTIDINYH